MRHGSSPLSMLALALLGGCGESDLSVAAVTSIPAGDASGSAASGSYSLKSITRDCSGSCPSFTYLIFTVKICEVGDTDSANATVVQQDGRLTVQGAGVLVDSLAGGIMSDGRFDVGGVGSQASGAVEVTLRATGTIDAAGAFNGTARARGSGTVDGKVIDCVGNYEITGARR